MTALVIPGALITLTGLAGIVLFMVKVANLRKAELDDEALRARMQKLLPLNLGSFLLSVLGIILIVIGMSFGS